MINDAIHNKTTDTRGRDLINKALRKGSQEVKILDTKKEVKQLKQEKIKLKTKRICCSILVLLFLVDLIYSLVFGFNSGEGVGNTLFVLTSKSNYLVNSLTR